MIQRIQSVFLFLAAATDFSVLGLPFATSGEAVQASALFSDKVYSIGDNIGLLLLYCASAALALAAIFLYKNRPLQVKIGQIALAANLLGMALAVVLFWLDQKNMDTQSISGGVGGFMPLVYLVFIVLAIRGIRKDEKLVRSADRLR